MTGKTHTFSRLLLDIDGTLWNTTEVVAEAWNTAAAQADIQIQTVSAAVLKKEFGKPMNIIASDLFPQLPLEKQTALMEQCCAAEQKAIAQTDQDLTYPDAAAVIAQISHTIPVYIVSNCQKGYIELVMKKIGITGYITDFECYGNTGKGKAENIALVVKRNHIAQPVYVGDTQGDSEACKEAGVPFIWAAYGFGKDVSCMYRINSFTDLSRIILHQ